MLTMLHAKTLSRKRFSTPAESKEISAPDIHGLDDSKSAIRKFCLFCLSGLKKAMELILAKEADAGKVKEPASTGKIYNLMR